MGKRSNHAKKTVQAKASQVSRRRRWLPWTLLLLSLPAIAAIVIMTRPSHEDAGVPVLAPLTGDARKVGCKKDGSRLTTVDLLAMSDDDLERMSLIEMNMVVACDMPECKDVDLAACEKAVNAWVEDFRKELPKAEALFRRHPERYKNDLDFFRLGLVMDYMGARLKMFYDPTLINVPGGARYTDPKSMFVHGLIQDRKGTCANMPVIQAAIARKLGWPVSLVPVKAHCFCRWDDGKKHLNIETTQTDKGGFSSGTDEEYMAREKITPEIQKNYLDLHTLTARQMLGVFIMHRGRLWLDRDQVDKAYSDFRLAQRVIPKHRSLAEMTSEIEARMNGESSDNPINSVRKIDPDQVNRENQENLERCRIQFMTPPDNRKQREQYEQDFYPIERRGPR